MNEIDYHKIYENINKKNIIISIPAGIIVYLLILFTIQKILEVI